MNDVVVLGAGFSAAASGHYPLTDELGRLALDRAGVPSEECPLEGTRFEVWLSRLAEDQPYRSVEDNLRARARFLQMSRALTEVLREREATALAEGFPPWLDDLVALLHAREATVVSFDYDHVIECAVERNQLIGHEPGLSGSPRVRADDVLDPFPPAPPLSRREVEQMLASSRWGSERYLPSWPRRDVADTFRLLKLHGSLSWYWSPDDTTGSTLQRWRVPGLGVAEDDAERIRALPGRVPFVVPPTATKSAYLTNQVVRALWARAYEALARADRVVFAGYSVPVEDQLAAGLLAETLAGRELQVVVADPCALQVVARLRELGIDARERTRRFDSIEDLVTWWVQEQAREAAARLAALAAAGHDTSAEARVLLYWGANSSGRIGRDEGPPDTASLAMRASGGNLVLTASANPVNAPNDAARLVDFAAGQPRLQRALIEHDGQRYPLIDLREPPPEGSYLQRFLVLVAAPHPSL